jgi:hypothetical protein
MVFLNGEFVCKLCDIVAHLPQPVFRKGEQVEGVKKGKRGDFLLR